MTRATCKRVATVVGAAALIAVSAGLASAAPARVATNTNLRQGPGTNFGIITRVPAGRVVDVIRCTAEWCNVLFGGRPGYVIARNLGAGGGPVGLVGAPPPAVVVAPPPVVVVEPPYGPYYGGYGPYYGGYGPYYRYGYGYRRGWRRW